MLADDDARDHGLVLDIVPPLDPPTNQMSQEARDTPDERALDALYDKVLWGYVSANAAAAAAAATPPPPPPPAPSPMLMTSGGGGGGGTPPPPAMMMINGNGGPGHHHPALSISINPPPPPPPLPPSINISTTLHSQPSYSSLLSATSPGGLSNASDDSRPSFFSLS
jgi:hypothetical protein